MQVIHYLLLESWRRLRTLTWLRSRADRVGDDLPAGIRHGGSAVQARHTRSHVAVETGPHLRGRPIEIAGVANVGPATGERCRVQTTFRHRLDPAVDGGAEDRTPVAAERPQAQQRTRRSCRAGRSSGPRRTWRTRLRLLLLALLGVGFSPTGHDRRTERRHPAKQAGDAASCGDLL